MRLDDEYSNYLSRISDHRPVMAKFLDDITGINDNPMPQNSDLISIYPNPFNSRAIISFDLPTRAEVRVEIYDIMGRKVASLLQGELAQGQHQISIDAGTWKTGVYFARLSAGRYLSVSKITLLK